MRAAIKHIHLTFQLGSSLGMTLTNSENQNTRSDQQMGQSFF
jgi:hypothetical protein